jgi:crossover junction endodeoxyribonuclease RuvC
MTRILGIDPGSRHTGYGLVEHKGNKVTFLHCGTLHLATGEVPARLGAIFTGLTEVLAAWKPDEVSIEKVFMARNADSALKLGQARGAAITAAVHAGLPVFEYSARQVKQAVVGKGGADKSQVQHMVQVLLALSRKPQADAADALAIALCHAHMSQSVARLASGGGGKVRSGRVRRQ